MDGIFTVLTNLFGSWFVDVLLMIVIATIVVTSVYEDRRGK